MNAIEVANLTKNYPRFTLNQVSLTLPQGSILGLVGENGAGKSTTIRLILNAIGRDGGSVRVLGEDNRSARFDSLKREIGVVLDEAYFPEVLTAKNVGRVMRRTYTNWQEEAYLGYLKRFALPEDTQFKDFSRGMKMKLGIAVALSHAPRLLILDEATSGLDPMVRDEILDIFTEFTRDETHSILLSSHIVSDLEKICDIIAFLHQGQIVLCEEKDRLLEEYRVVKLTRAELAALPREAILGCRENGYGAQALMERSRIPAGLCAERATLEEIILLMAKGAEQK